MAGVCVIVAYRPKPGKEAELLALVRARVPTLRQEGLVTERAPVIMRAKDGTLLEVSEWKSRAAIEAAHQNPNAHSRAVVSALSVGSLGSCHSTNRISGMATLLRK